MILHITTKQDWERALQDGQYTIDSLEKDGFIHCSRVDQICRVADYNFPSQEGLVLLCINEANLLSPVRDEDLYQLNETYPHIYGPINLDAVEQVADFPPLVDGTFEVPQQVLNLVNS